MVGAWLWFTDGHLLPYTGKAAVHYAYNTQRRMPVPGRTNLVATDETGRVVSFAIEEGKGDLRARIGELGRYGGAHLPLRPGQVFDREGHGSAFFSTLVREGTPFVTWEKHANRERLAALEAERFAHTFTLNGKDYAVFEEDKAMTHTPEDGGEAHAFTLRRIVLWNRTSHRRASGLCWDAGHGLSTEEAARAILTRWGASENTFKHLKERHPLHYHPGFGLRNSDKQDIANPAIRDTDQALKSLATRLTRLYKRRAKTTPQVNADGTPRSNSRYQRLHEQIQALEAEQQRLREARKAMPERVDVSGLEDYRAFQRVDNEGKNLFDFATTAVWNARKQLTDWLRLYYNQDNDLVDLLYAIVHCHGWVRSDADYVTVRLEPLQQPKRRQAQEQLCRKLTGLGARTPKGKWLVLEVGDSPL